MDEVLVLQRVQEVRHQVEQVLGQLGVDQAITAPVWQALTALDHAVRPPAVDPSQWGDRFPASPGAAAALASPGADSLRDPVARLAQLTQVLRDAPMGICLLEGADYHFTFSNPSYDQLAGRTHIVGKSLAEVFPELAGQSIYDLLDGVMATGIPFVTPEILVQLDRDGDGVVEDIYYAFTYMPLYDARGQVTGVIDYVQDITDRRALEDERARVLHLTQAALDAADAERQRLLALLHQAPAAICTLEGPDHRFTFTNAAYDRFIGRTDLIGRAARSAVPELHEQGFFDLVDQVYATGVPQVGTDVPVQLDRHGTGVLDQAFMRYTLASMRDDAGAITGVFIQLVDVTELVTARQAEAAVALRDQFLSIAAHELRTPLTTLIGYIGLIQRRMHRTGGLDARTAEILTLLDAQGQRLSRLIDTLLDVARINIGRLSLDRVPLDVGALVHQVVEEIQVIAASLPIHVTLPAMPCVVQGDRLRLEQVLVNLVQNALKYSPHGGTVTVNVGCDTGQVWVQVRDQGLGIPAADLPHLFERFYRVAHGTSAALPGMGLGLAIVHEIVTLHGGTITVESTEGVGSTFTVTLPLANDGAQVGSQGC